MATSAKSKPAAEVDDWDSSPKKPGAASDGADDWEEAQLAAEPGLRPGSLSGSSLKSGAAALLDALGGSSDTVAKNLADKMSLGNASQYAPGFRRDLAYQNKEFPDSATAGKAAGIVGLGSMAGSVAPLRVLGDLSPTAEGAALARTGGINLTPALSAAAQGLAEAPGKTTGFRDDLYKRVANVPAATAIGVGTHGLTSLAGAGGDRLMQRAVGMNHYEPGLGTDLAENGVWGTRGMMKNQVKSARDAAYGQLNDLATNQNTFNDLLPSQSVANNVRKLGDRYNFGDTTSSLDTGKLRSIEDAAADIDSRGFEPQKVMLGRRAAAGQRVSEAGWNNSDPAQAMQNQISKAEQRGYSDVLHNANPDMIPVDKTYGNMAEAYSALRRPEPIGALPRYGVPGAGAAAGMLAGGPIGGLIGAGVGHMATTPLGMSSLGRMGIAAEKYSPALSAEAIDALVRKSMKEGQ